MSWKIIIHFKDRGTHEVSYVETPEIAAEKIQKIFKEGLTIQTAKRYTYYPPLELKMAEAIKTEQKTSGRIIYSYFEASGSQDLLASQE